MSEILSFLDILLSHPDILPFLIVIVVCIVAFCNYGEKAKKYVQNKRNRWWFVYLGIMFALQWILISKNIIFGKLAIVNVLILMAYAVAFIRSLKPKTFHDFSDPILRRYEKWMLEGSTMEHIDYFRSPGHWYLYTTEDKLEYHMLACLYFAEIQEYENAYEELELISDEWLYDSEKELISLQRALLLALMGSPKAAFLILGEPENNVSNNPMVWFTYSFIFENAGDIDNALRYMEKARSIVEIGGGVSVTTAAEIYNNYSRVAMIKGNTTEALRYIISAWKYAKQSKDTRTAHIIAGNMVAQMATSGKTRDECEAALKEYRDYIAADSFMNKISYNNCAVQYYRQIGDVKKEYSLIKAGYRDVIEHLNSSQAILYTASTFRMLMNGHFEHRWFDKNVDSLIQHYQELSLMDRLVAFKEYMGIFQQEEFRSIYNKAPYKGLRLKILKYYQQNAIAEIEEAIVKAKEYNIVQYRFLMEQKLYILKTIEGKDHINKSKKLYVELYNLLRDHGMHLDAVRVLLILLDECTSAENVMIIKPGWPGFRYYSDFMNQSSPPDPLDSPDGIHLIYYRFAVREPFAIKPMHNDIIREYIDDIIRDFQSWKNHPFKIELSIEIAHLLMCIDRWEEAEECLRYFDESGISEKQMASWIRDDIHQLRIDIERRKRANNPSS